MDMEKEITQFLKENIFHAIEKHVEKDEKTVEKDEKKKKKKENLSNSILSLKEKCCDGFEERERDPSKAPLYNQFAGIKESLKPIFEDLSRYDEKEIRGILYSIDDAWTECQITPKADFITKESLRRKLNGIKTQIGKLEKKQGSSSQPADTATPPSGKESDASDLKVYGFDDEVISLQKVLLKESDDGFKAMAIVGMAGVGKTALCQSLLSKTEVKEHFLPRIWVRKPGQRGNDEDKKEDLRSMLASLGVEKKILDEVRKEPNLKGLLYAVSRQLQGKRYLVVLDDARYPEDWYVKLKSGSPRYENWNSLADGLPKDSGGAVIVTSRKEKLAKDMIGEKGIHHVQPLVDPDHCWLIYQDAAETTIDKFGPSINEKILKEELQRRCAGHPLTAKLMGEMTKVANG